MVDCGDPESDEFAEDGPSADVWLKKLDLIRKRISQIERTNLKIINRIYHVRKYVKHSQRIKRLLMKRLDKHRDQYNEYDTYFDIDVLKESKLSSKPSGGSEKSSKKHRSTGSAHPTVKQEKPLLEKDPNAPKKPVNAFILFCQQKRTEYLRENPSIAHHDLNKLLAKSWNMLRMEDKQTYYDMYERDKERYEQELEQYTEKLQSQGSSKSNITSSKSQCIEDADSSPGFGCQSQFMSNRDPRISAVISPSLSDSSGISFQLTSLPSPTMTSQEEDSFAISNIPSPGF